MGEDYVLGNLENEITRLEIQSAFFEPLTRQTLLRAGIKKGMRCLDVGCGAGSVTQILAEFVGKKGQVVGTDVDEKYLQYCRNYSTEDNTNFVLDDILKSRLPKESFETQLPARNDDSIGVKGWRFVASHRRRRQYKQQR